MADDFETTHSFFAKLGTIKGMSEMALYMRDRWMRHPVFGLKKCDEDINVFGDYISIAHPHYYSRLTELSRPALQEELLQIHTLMRWIEFGMSTFDLTHSLMASLLLTDPSDVDASAVKLPFGTFAIRLPDNFWTMHGHQGESMSAAHILVHTYLAASRRGAGPHPMFSLRIVGRSGTTSTWETRIPIPESGKIGDWIADDVPEVSDDTGVVVPPDENDKYLAISARRLIVNVCLYIAARGRGEPLGGSSRKNSRPAKISRSSPDIWVLGREIKLDPELVKSAKAWTDRASSSEWRLRGRRITTGHWRNVAHGERHALRTLKYIEPYWRGEGTPTFSHVYKLGEE
jgi:hypothetical protein